MNKLFSSAAIVAVSQAIKVRDSSSPWTLSSTTGDMGQVVTDHDVNDIDDLDAVKAELAGWYDDKAVTFISSHKQKVYQAALAEMEEEHGPLLETCDEGTLCRENYLKLLRERVQEIWTKTIAEFRTSIFTAVQDTENVITTNWTKLVQCEIDHPCCAYSEITWINHTKVLQKKRSEHVEYVTKWKEFELKRVELYNRCPINIGDSCANLSDCWDGSARDTTNHCGCPVQAPPACPATPCENGITREIHSCKCLPEGLPSAAINIQTAYIDSVEMMRITWDRVATKEIKGSNVFIKGEQVHCHDKTMTLAKEVRECDIPIYKLFEWTSGAYQPGDVVQAQIQEVHEDNVYSELSDFGGLGALPLIDIFTERIESWEGTYGEINAETGLLEKHPMTMQKLYIGDSGLIYGEGLDSQWGPFKVSGEAIFYPAMSLASITFWQIYDNVEWADYIYMYQGQLNIYYGDHQSIGGNWETYDPTRVGAPLNEDFASFQLVKVRDLSDDYLTWDYQTTTTVNKTYVDENGVTQQVTEQTTD